MLHRMYHWEIPKEKVDEFACDWKALTEQAQAQCGLISSELFTINGSLFSIAVWPAEENWLKWNITFRDHPFRVKWRDYKKGDGGNIRSLARVSQK